MRSDIAISVKNLTKTYRIFGHPGDRIKQALTMGRMKFHKEFIALQDISLEIKRGETVGIIGRNGSGKSTLLELICGILKPTSGTVQVNGRVSALLELGAGFNPEFTGRENVYFQGAVMGIGKEEMELRFDDIATFADIGEFIDQPVRTYSSGMYVRLAFAVAVHADAEIVVVDEALAVGDEAFQRKCFSRLSALREEGTTILFVSHSAAAVTELCSGAVLLENGEILAIGSPKSLVDRYHKLLYAPPERMRVVAQEIRDAKETDTKVEDSGVSDGTGMNYHFLSQNAVYYESRGAWIENPCITCEDGRPVNILERGKTYIYRYEVRFEQEARDVRFAMLIKTKTGFELGGITSHSHGDGITKVEGPCRKTVAFPFRCNLLPGLYFLNSGVLGNLGGSEQFLHRVIDILAFHVQAEADLLAGGVVDFSIQEKPMVTP